MGRNQDGHLTVRCTAGEAERIRQAATKARVSLTEFLLATALNQCAHVESGHPTVIFKLEGFAAGIRHG